MKLISFGGVSLDDASTQSGLPWDGARDQFRLAYSVALRPKNTPVVNALAFSERKIPVYLHVPRGVEISDALERFQGFLLSDPFTPRMLVAQRKDGTLVQRPAYVTRPNGALPDGAINGLLVEFVSEQTEWTVVTPAAATRVPTGSIYTVATDPTWSAEVSFTVPGSAPVSPVVTIDPNNPGSGTHPNRYSFTLRNDKTTPIEDQLWQHHLGDTTGWTGSTTANTYLFCDGREVPREIIALGSERSYVVFTIDLLAPGQAKTYEVITGGTTALPTAPAAMNGRIRAAVPDFGWAVLTATGSGANGLTITASGIGSEVNRWKNAIVWQLTGSGAGTAAVVDANSGTALSTNGTTGAYVVGNKFLVIASWLNYDSTRLVLNYAVRETDHSDYPHGLWYQDRAQDLPTDIRYDSPGSWEPIRSWDNDDDVAFRSVSPAVGDYFTTPNISRTYRGGDDNSSLKERGGGDGVTFSSSLPIAEWKLDYRARNPNGVAKAIIAGKQIPDEDWTVYVEDTTARATLTDVGEQTITLQSGTQHLLFALWPRIGDEIPTSWARDTGGRTGGGYTTLTDGDKEWTPGQWVGATLRITDGKGQGIRRTIISNTINTVTWSDPLPDDDVVPNDSSRYELVNKPLIANLRTHDVFRLSISLAGITASGLTPLGPAERVAVRVRIGGGDDGVDPYTRLDVGCDERRLWIAAGQNVIVDCAAMTAWVVDGTTGARLKDVTDWVGPREKRSDGVIEESEDWLRVLPGATVGSLQRTGGVASYAAHLSLPAGYFV